MMAEGGDWAEGLLIEGLEGEALERIDYYEAAFGYTRHEIILEDGATAAAYLPDPGRWEAAEDWSLADWSDRWGEMVTLAAEEAMSMMGQVPAPVMGNRYPQILHRAAARLRARGGQGAGTRRAAVLAGRRRRYTNFFAVEELDLSFPRYDGSMSPVVERALFVVGDAALVLPYDPVRDRVLLIEQFRAGPFNRDDPEPWLWEPIAGRIDPGETPQDAARREAVEEAGIALTDLHLVSSGYPSPGTTTEHFDIFVGLADLPDDVTGVGGVASEDEDIRSHVVGWADFDARLCAHGFRVTPLELAGHWLARNRERLRASP